MKIYLFKICCSSGSGGVLHLLGAVPCTAAAGGVCGRQPRGGSQCRHGHRVPHVDLYLRRALLPVHHCEPGALPHHVPQVPRSLQGKLANTHGMCFHWFNPCIRQVAVFPIRGSDRFSSHRAVSKIHFDYKAKYFTLFFLKSLEIR